MLQVRLPELSSETRWPTDAALIEAVVGGDEKAAEALYVRFQRLVSFMAWRFAVGNRATAEDLTQEIWMHLFTVALAAWRQGQGSLGGFIAKTAYNKAVD